MKKLNFVVVAAFLLVALFSNAVMAGNPYYTIKLTANGGKGLVYAKEGDEITIERVENMPGEATKKRLTRNDYMIDTKNINWENGYKWTATPGIHYIRRFIRWKTDGLSSDQMVFQEGGLDYMHQWIVIIVGGPYDENEFRHPGMMVTSAELGQIQKNIQINGHPMKAAWASYKKDVDKRWLNHQHSAVDTFPMDPGKVAPYDREMAGQFVDFH